MREPPPPRRKRPLLEERVEEGVEEGGAGVKVAAFQVDGVSVGARGVAVPPPPPSLEIVGELEGVEPPAALGV